MGDKDEAESANGTRDRESLWQWKWVPVIVPQVKVLLILLPPLNEGLAVLDNILTLMAIHIHAFPRQPILPFKSCEPVTSCALRNPKLNNPRP